MSLFLDEKTKEEKFLKAREDREKGLSESLIELDRKGEWLHKLWFNYGWNECEKHVRESVIKNFPKELLCQQGLPENQLAALEFTWQNAQLSSLFKIEQLEVEIAAKDKEIEQINNRIMSLKINFNAESSRNERHEAKIQSLESLIAEKDKRIKLLEGMVENGLGWEDMKNEI